MTYKDLIANFEPATMSITAGLPLVQEKGHQISYNRRHNNSGELDVFDAAKYFSGANEMYGASFTLQQKMMRSGGRMSLDNPMMSGKANSIPSPTRYQKSKKYEKKHRQPNSPGSKLANFLNLLFNQVSSKKIISYTQSMNGDQDHEIGRRKRRSSISHFRNLNKKSSSTSNSSDSKSSSFYSSSTASAFNTPPVAHTYTKNSSEDIQSHSAHSPNVMVISSNSSKMNKINVSSCSSHTKIYVDEKTENSWMHAEKFKFRPSNEFLLEKCSNFVNGILGDKTDHSEDSTNFTNDEDDGADSDSSSDLFELQNFDLLSCFSSDSLAYESTDHVASIKRGAQIASGAI